MSRTRQVAIPLALALIFTQCATPFVALALEQEPVIVESSTITEVEAILATITEASVDTPVSTTTAETIPAATPAPEPAVIDPASYVPGEILVKYKDSALDLETNRGQAIASDIANTLNLTEQDTIPVQNIAVLSTDSSTSIESVIEDIESNPNVEYAEPNYIRSIETITASSTELANLWAFHNSGQSVNGITGTADADTDALEAWSIATGTDVVVAVIDTGVDYTHPDLANNMWDGASCVSETGAALGDCLHGYNFENENKDPIATSSTGNPAHGTHVAGVIAATHNEVGTVGIAPGVKIMALRFALDTASEIKAIDFAIQNGAKIINASFSGSASSTAEYNAIKRFQDAGGIFVAAAANNSANLEATTTLAYPASYDLPGIITVAATDQHDVLAPYSNYGAISVDLAAPGTTVYSTLPLGGYGYKTGTSMAAPMVAGAVALMQGYQPSLSPTAIKELVLSSGDSLPSLATTTVSGKRLNVYNALASLVSTSTPDTTAPVITLIGDNPLSLTVGATFTDPGASVSDNVDATTTISGTGSVDTGVAGTYTLTYTAQDQAGNRAATTTRSVIVTAPVVSSGGGGGGGGGGGAPAKKSNGGGSSPIVTPPVAPAPINVPRLPVANTPTPKVLGVATYTFTQDLSLGSTGAEVGELQKTLARLNFYTGPVSGYFGPLTQAAVRAFQQSRGLQQVGRVGPQTRSTLNSVTGTVGIQHTAPTTTSIAALQAQIQILLTQLAALQARTH